MRLRTFLQAGLTMEKLKSDIQEGKFENDPRQYVSRYSFVRGMFG